MLQLFVDCGRNRAHRRGPRSREAVCPLGPLGWLMLNHGPRLTHGSLFIAPYSMTALPLAHTAAEIVWQFWRAPGVPCPMLRPAKLAMRRMRRGWRPETCSSCPQQCSTWCSTGWELGSCQGGPERHALLRWLHGHRSGGLRGQHTRGLLGDHPIACTRGDLHQSGAQSGCAPFPPRPPAWQGDSNLHAVAGHQPRRVRQQAVAPLLHQPLAPACAGQRRVRRPLLAGRVQWQDARHTRLVSGKRLPQRAAVQRNPSGPPVPGWCWPASQ